MKKLITIVTLLLWISGFSQNKTHQHDHGPKPVEFIENQNQWNDNVLYKADLAGGVVYLEEEGFTYNFMNVDDRASMHDIRTASEEEQVSFMIRAHAWKFIFENANNAELIPQKLQKHYYNYFLGDDQTKWASHVPVFNTVFYKNIYNGINLKLYSHNGNFKYDWIVSPNSDPNQIVIAIDGIESPKIQDGNLKLETTVGEFIESKPYAYQLIDSKLIEVECKYLLEGKKLSFVFPNGYNTSMELVIDPELIAATLSGTPSSGFADNYGHTATFDSEGNIYTGCTAGGDNYPATTGGYQISYGGGIWDCGISKLNSSGTDLLWATFIGGSSSDYPHSMITNSNSELYVYGSTSSSNFPTTDDAFQSDFGGVEDLLISHLSSDGSELIGSTYVGGASTDGRNGISANYGDEFRGEIILDNNQNPVVASCSSSNDFPTTADAYQSDFGGMQDAVVLRLNETLSTLEMSTYFGGSDFDNAYAVKVNSSGNIYLAGAAGDNISMSTDAYQSTWLGGVIEDLFGVETDGFVAVFNSAGDSLITSTYIGTSSGDQVFFMELDTDDDVFIYGQGGTDWPVVGDVYVNEERPQFVAKLSSDLTELLLSTTIGGTDELSEFDSYEFVPVAFLVDNCDNVYISSYQAYGNFPLTDDALYTEGEFYLAVYSSGLESLEFATKYSGWHVDGGTSRFDKNGTVYQAVCSGGGFTTTSDAWAQDQATGWDVGIFKIDFDVSGVNSAVVTNSIGCVPFDLSLDNQSNGDTYSWDFGDGFTSTEFEPIHTYTDSGTYVVTLIAMDSLSCNLADTTSFEIYVGVPVDIVPEFTYTINCEDQTIECINTTDDSNFGYTWAMGDGTSLTTYNAEHEYVNTGDYTVNLMVENIACSETEQTSQEITIYPHIDVNITLDDIVDSCGSIQLQLESTSINVSTYLWDFGNGETSAEENPSHLFTGPNSYQVIFTGTNAETCNEMDSDTLLINIFGSSINAEFSYQQINCELTDVYIDDNSTGSNLSYTWDMGDGTVLTGANPLYTYQDNGDYTISLAIANPTCNEFSEFSLPVKVNYSIQADIFTPNGDEKNREFRIYFEDDVNSMPSNSVITDYFAEYSMEIYNRWGNKLFDTSEEDSDFWDGGDYPEGVYYYIIKYQRMCTDESIRNYSGYVHLSR